MWTRTQQTTFNRRRFLFTLGALGLTTVVGAACQQPAASPSNTSTSTGTSPQPTTASGQAESKTAPPAQAPAASSGPVTVSFTSQGNQSDLAMFDRIFDAFEKQQSRIKIDRKYDTTLDWPKVINQIRSGTASDVMRTNDDDIFLLLASDVITSLDDYVNRSIRRDDYFDVAFTSRVGPGGEIGSALVGTAPTVMFYNVELFEAAGVKPPTDWETDNWTIDDLEQAMQQLTKKSGDRVEVYGWVEPYWWLETALWNEGVPLYNEDETQAQLATPEGIALTERYQRWYLEGWAVPPGENHEQLFNSGLLAMVYEDMNFKNSIRGSVKWDIAPTAKGKVHNGAFHNDRNFTIPKHSKVKDEAWEVLLFFLSQSEDGQTGGQAEIARNDWGVPVLEAAATGPLFNDPAKPPPNRKILAQGAEKAWPLPDNPMGEQFQVIFRNIDTLRTGQQSAEAFLKAGEESLNRVIAETKWDKSKDVRGWRIEGAGSQ